MVFPFQMVRKLQVSTFCRNGQDWPSCSHPVPLSQVLKGSLKKVQDGTVAALQVGVHLYPTFSRFKMPTSEKNNLFAPYRLDCVQEGGEYAENKINWVF